MTEKRFSLEYYDNMSYVNDNFNDDEYYLYWAVELMNELYEENKKLKYINDQLEEQLESSGCGIKHKPLLPK